MIRIGEDNKKWLQDLLGDWVRFDEPMMNHTSFRVGGPADAFAIVNKPDMLIQLIKGLGERKLPFWVIGRGTNVLVRDKGIRGVVIRLKKTFEDTTVNPGEGIIKAMAGAPMSRICRMALRNCLSGFNFALGIPGTVGGGIVTNAGTSSGNVGNVLSRLTYLSPDGELKSVSGEKLQFSYRQMLLDSSQVSREISGPVILEGVFRLQPDDPQKLKKQARELIRRRKSNQPTWLPSAGCFFKNPDPEKPAGQLIDLAGFKGKSRGGAEVSHKHANFIVNRKNASAADILVLMEMIREAVWKNFNIMLEPEVKIIGD